MKNIILLFSSMLILSFISCAGRDNPDDPLSADYKISAWPAAGNNATIVGHEDLVIRFSDSIQTTSVTLGGGSLLGTINVDYKLSWSNTNYTNDTLTITQFNTALPVKLWSKGAVTLTVQGTTADGKSVPLTTMNFTAVYKVFVNSTTGNDSDTAYYGTRTKPYGTIKKGIDKAKLIYTDYAAAGVDVCVAQGTYTVNWNTATNQIVMTEGISLYGGYISDFSQRSPTVYVTTITDQSSAGGTAWTNPNRAVDFNSSAITNATILDGFTINGGGSAAGWATAIFCYAGASPTIQNNVISGGSSNNGRTYGIINSSSPKILNNTISGGTGNVSAGTSAGYSYGIYNQPSSSTCSPIINDNTIDGGSGYYSYGVDIFSSNNPVVSRNKISAGQGDQITYGIYIYSTTSLDIINNCIFGGTGKAQTYGIYCRATSPRILNNTIDGGRSNSSTPSGLYCLYIYDATSNPQIMNNILLITDGSLSTMSRFGVFEGAALTLTSMKNNDIDQTCSGALYYDTVSGNVTSVATINGWGGGYSSNIDTAPVFVSYISSTTWSAGDLHLTTGADSTIRTGGLDGGPLGLNWGFTTDKDSVTRTGNNTTGWSMGAYERD